VILLFFIYFCEAIVTAATPSLLCQPRVIVKMIVEKQMECKLAGETEVLGENLPKRHFCPILMLSQVVHIFTNMCNIAIIGRSFLPIVVTSPSLDLSLGSIILFLILSSVQLRNKTTEI
jgi:hypothetical protein